MTYETLKYDAQYFKNHSAHWDQVSVQLGGTKAKATTAKAGDGALWTTLVPGFKSTHDRICSLIIDSLLKEGAVATSELADLLESTCRAYVATEADNAAQADSILNEVGY